MDDVILNKVGDSTSPKSELPRGVYAIRINEQIFFVRRVAGRFVQLSPEEQEKLNNKHIL